MAGGGHFGGYDATQSSFASRDHDLHADGCSRQIRMSIVGVAAAAT